MTTLNDLQRLNEVLEPFDPAYLTNKGYEIPQLSSYEKRFLHKVSILEKKLRRNGIKYEWLEDDECFRIRKYRLGSEYPVYMYLCIYMDENKYAFGGETEDVCVDGHASKVVEAALKWLNSTYSVKSVKQIKR